MYLVAIAWIYVVLLMALAEASQPAAAGSARPSLPALRRSAARRSCCTCSARRRGARARRRPSSPQPSRRGEPDRGGHPPGDAGRAGTKRTVTRPDGAPAAAADPLDPGRRQAVARQRRQVGQPLARLAAGAKRGARVRVVAGSAPPKASTTSAPTSKARRPDAGAEPGVAGPPGRQSAASHRLATVASSTPAARPRQPAWAAPTPRPSGAANRTGRQSATCTVQAMPGSVVTLASASCTGAPGSGIGTRQPDDARPVHLAQEHRRGAAVASASSGPIRGDPLGRVADGDAAGSSRRTAPRTAPPSRVDISAPTPAARPVGGSQSPAGSRRVRAGGGLGRAERRSSHAALEDPHHRRHMIECGNPCAGR